MARYQSLIEGRWRIAETELWDQEALDVVVPAYMRFDRSGLGEMELIAIGARGATCGDPTENRQSNDKVGWSVLEESGMRLSWARFWHSPVGLLLNHPARPRHDRLRDGQPEEASQRQRPPTAVAPLVAPVPVT